VNILTSRPMAKGPGVSATSRIIATSQTNVHYYIKNRGRLQEKLFIYPYGKISIYSTDPKSAIHLLFN